MLQKPGQALAVWVTMLSRCNLLLRPVIKQNRTGDHFDCTGGGSVTLQNLSKDVLEAFRDFLYKAKFPSDKGLVDRLQRFANKYSVDSLKKMCGKSKGQLKTGKEMLAWPV